MSKPVASILAAVLALAPFTTALAQPEGATPATPRRIDLKSLSPEALDKFLKESFQRTDKNGDGFIDYSEAPEKRVTKTKNGQTMSETGGKDLWIADYDENKDKKVSWDEYRKFTVAMVKRAPR